MLELVFEFMPCWPPDNPDINLLNLLEAFVDIKNLPNLLCQNPSNLQEIK